MVNNLRIEGNADSHTDTLWSKIVWIFSFYLFSPPPPGVMVRRGGFRLSKVGALTHSLHLPSHPPYNRPTKLTAKDKWTYFRHINRPTHTTAHTRAKNSNIFKQTSAPTIIPRNTSRTTPFTTARTFACTSPHNNNSRTSTRDWSSRVRGRSENRMGKYWHPPLYCCYYLHPGAPKVTHRAAHTNAQDIFLPWYHHQHQNHQSDKDWQNVRRRQRQQQEQQQQCVWKHRPTVLCTWVSKTRGRKGLTVDSSDNVYTMLNLARYERTLSHSIGKCSGRAATRGAYGTILTPAIVFVLASVPFFCFIVLSFLHSKYGNFGVLTARSRGI